MRISKCLSKWRNGQPVLGITLHFMDASLFEMVSRMGFDVIWIDLEHHAHSLETAASMMRAARVGDVDILARPAKGEFMRMARLLEAGANGIMYPRCDSAEEAREVIQQAKFAPMGKRGIDGAGPDALYGTVPLTDYLQHANEETFVLIQIESREGLDSVEEIAGIEGVDMLFFGLGDYSLQNGFPGDFDDPRYWEAVEKVAAAAKAAGSMWGTPSLSAAHAQRLLDMGAMFITYGSDLTLLRRRFSEVQEAFRPLGFEFDSDK